MSALCDDVCVTLLSELLLFSIFESAIVGLTIRQQQQFDATHNNTTRVSEHDNKSVVGIQYRVIVVFCCFVTGMGFVFSASGQSHTLHNACYLTSACCCGCRSASSGVVDCWRFYRSTWCFVGLQSLASAASTLYNYNGGSLPTHAAEHGFNHHFNDRNRCVWLLQGFIKRRVCL